MSDFKLVTPVAFIIFNRPDTTERVFSAIAKARPSKLLVVADGARIDRAGEVERVAATRAIIKRVDWPCEVLTNFSEENLGCKRRVSSGIDWVFEQVEEAIILEDDCLPAPTFFRFCQEMLERYRHDLRVGMVSGNNFQFGQHYSGDSYYFSKYTYIWGWASWRNRWQEAYDVRMSKWPKIRDSGGLVDLVLKKSEVGYWKKIFDRMYSGKADTWDFQWTFANWTQGWLAVLPSVNLISNIGFGVGATHSRVVTKLANMPIEDLSFPLIHPGTRVRNIRADEANFWIYRPALCIRMAHKLKWLWIELFS